MENNETLKVILCRPFLPAVTFLHIYMLRIPISLSSDILASNGEVRYINDTFNDACMKYFQKYIMAFFKCVVTFYSVRDSINRQGKFLLQQVCVYSIILQLCHHLFQRRFVELDGINCLLTEICFVYKRSSIQQR